MEQSQSRLDVAFPFEPGDALLSALQDLMRVLEARLQGAERQQASADQQADVLVDVGLARINAVLLPQVLKIQKLTALGFLVCQSSSSVRLEIAQKTFMVSEGDAREFFTPSPFVTIESRADFSTYAVGRVLTYDAKTGALVVSIIGAYGDGLPHTDWTISCSSGVGLAVTAAANNAAGSATAAAASAVKTAADALATAADRAAARGDRLAADASAQAAANSAAAAATWDPANYVPRGGAVVGAGGANFAFQDTLASAIKDRAGDGSAIQVRGKDATSAAAMTFHRPGAYATWFGVDTDNEWAFGGWSNGAARFKFWTEKNIQPLDGNATQTFTRVQLLQFKNNLQLHGGIKGIGATQTLLPTDANKDITLSETGYTVTLPLVSSMTNGDFFQFCNRGTGTITIARNAGDNSVIYWNGGSSSNIPLGPGQTLRLVTDSAHWYLSNRAVPPDRVPSIDVDQAFTQAQKALARRNIGAGYLRAQVFANTVLVAADLNNTIWIGAANLTINLPPTSAAVGGDYIEFVNYTSAPSTIAANRTGGETSGIYFAGSGGSAATMVLGPGQSARLTTDGGSWVVAFRALVPELAAALAGAAFTGGISAPSLSIAGRPIVYPSIGGTSGGNQGDINTAQENRLSYGFTAGGTSLIATASTYVSNSSSSAADIYYTLRLIDQTAGNAGVQDKSTVRFAAPVAGSTGGVEITMLQSSLTIGHYYTLNLLLSKGQAVGPIYPNGMQLQHLNF